MALRAESGPPLSSSPPGAGSTRAPPRNGSSSRRPGATRGGRLPPTTWPATIFGIRCTEGISGTASTAIRDGGGEARPATRHPWLSTNRGRDSAVTLDLTAWPSASDAMPPSGSGRRLLPAHWSLPGRLRVMPAQFAVERHILLCLGFQATSPAPGDQAAPPHRDCVGVSSSRKIARAVTDGGAFRWLTANNRPDFRTIAAGEGAHGRGGVPAWTSRGSRQGRR